MKDRVNERSALPPARCLSFKGRSIVGKDRQHLIKPNRFFIITFKKATTVFVSCRLALEKLNYFSAARWCRFGETFSSTSPVTNGGLFLFFLSCILERQEGLLFYLMTDL